MSIQCQFQLKVPLSTWKALGRHSEGTWALGHSKDTRALEDLRHSGTQALRALGHLGTWALYLADSIQHEEN